jgi:GT2 family glycosyltransferase
MVSVIVPTMSQATHLATCLASLQQYAPAGSSHEIVVVLNGATPAVRDVARTTAGIRIVESAVNRGFAGGCHLGVRASSGAFLTFLNDDVRVTRAWLDPLLETMRDRPRAGAVGPRVLGADDTVQEVGSIIWRDGSTRPLGRGLPASSLSWRWRRRVDYASACALLVRREAWDAVGGFDEGYHPAYYEDVDFCLALERSGYEVWVDPRSDVVHAESASTDPPFKRFLFARHHARLAERWPAALADRVRAPVDEGQLAGAERTAVERLQAFDRRVLVVDDRVPRHGLGSGFDRMADAVLALAAAGMQVRCVSMEMAPEFVPALAAAGVEVLDDPADDVLARELPASDVVIVSRPNNAARVQAVLATLPPGRRPRYVYDAEALYHRRLDRQASLEAGEAAAVLRAQCTYWRTVECGVAAHADAIVCVSRDEAAFFERSGAPDVRVQTPWLRQASLTDGTLAGRADIGLVAGWLAGAGSPNGDALEWFASEVLPLIAKEVPWVRLRVTGTLPSSLQHLEGLHVRAEGFVDDLAGFYRHLRVAVAPLRFGAGVKLKTVEAVQHGVPVVATSVGAEGLESLGDAVVVRDAPDAFAEAIVLRLLDAAVWRAHRRAIEATLRRVPQDVDWTALVAGLGENGADVGRAV